MDWRAVDKVAAWRIFRKRMTIIFIADAIPTEQQYAKVLVAGGDEAFIHWQVVEPLMQADNKKPAEDIDAFWDYFEKSFEQTASHWHYIDQYLSDFRQEPDETTADLDLCILELVKRCKFPDAQTETRRLELLFHATNLFLIHEHIVDTPGVKYEDCIQKAYRTPCSQHMLYNSVDEDQLAVEMVHVGSVVGPMKEAIALLMGTSALNAVV